MSRHSEIKDIEHRIRSSMTYHLWLENNLGLACLNCDSTENLQVHHIVELYHILLGLWKLYGEPESVVAHALAMHADDKCEATTLCKTCHDKIHPGKNISQSVKEIRTDDWTALPRKLPGTFIHHPKNASEDGMTLIGAQLLAGIGWHILNGRMESRIIEFKIRQMAKLLGKKPGSSFNKSLNRALNDLLALNVIIAHHRTGPDMEIHLGQEYLKSLSDLPWFMSVPDIHTSKMPVFALRWFLGLQSGRRTYKIGKDKLVSHMSLKTASPAFVERCVRNACEDIKWATCDYDGTYFSFRIRQRGAVPIWTLRSIVRDSINEGN
jgi:hypothetical protein